MANNMVQQTPDNLVIVRVPPKVYIDTTAHFNVDFGETAPVIPMGSNDRVYEPGKRHALMLDGNVMGGGPLPWDVGDRWITKIDAGLAAQAARQPDLPDLGP
jgi:hypothetical protein